MHVVVFAAGLDWLEGLLPVLFVLFWLVSQVVNVVRNVAGRGQPQRPRPVEPVRPPRPELERVEEVRTDLERQIDEFLKQKAERRGEPAPVRIPPRPQAPPRPQSVRAKTEKPRIEKERTAKTGPTASPARGSRAESVVADVVKKSQPPAPQLGSLGSHGGDIARHVRDAFADDLEHRPSRLTKPMAAATEPAATRPAVAASDLVTLLRDPAALRRLFIVREVLDRPIDRW